MSLTISAALALAPGTPSAPGVSTSSVPSRRMMARRSLDIVSGMVMMTLYPRAAPTRASPTPVFPEVASTMVPPGLRSPEASAASMMDLAIRSLTLEAGL